MLPSDGSTPRPRTPSGHIALAPDGPHNVKRLAKIRLSCPVVGTPLSSFAPLASLRKSTGVLNGDMSPPARADDWKASHHEFCSALSFAGSRTGSRRGAALKKAGGRWSVPEPPGCVMSAVACGMRYRPLAVSQSPTPTLIGTTCVPGFHAVCGTVAVY